MTKNNVRFRAAAVGYVLLITAAFVSGQPVTHDAPVPAKFETRCGWFINPTPANASLEDKDGEWIIAVQGGYQAEGDWPAFKPRQWVETNVHYGYGCACMRVKVDRESRRVLEIKSAYARSLAACRRDRKLKEPR
jgi:hypothetical protein